MDDEDEMVKMKISEERMKEMCRLGEREREEEGKGKRRNCFSFGKLFHQLVLLFNINF